MKPVNGPAFWARAAGLILLTLIGAALVANVILRPLWAAVRPFVGPEADRYALAAAGLLTLALAIPAVVLTVRQLRRDSRRRRGEPEPAAEPAPDRPRRAPPRKPSGWWFVLTLAPLFVAIVLVETAPRFPDPATGHVYMIPGTGTPRYLTAWPYAYVVGALIVGALSILPGRLRNLFGRDDGRR